MRTKTSIALLLTMVVILASVATVQPRAASEECQYFQETGHYVCGEFLAFFAAKGGLEIFGYPLTEAFEDPTHDNLRVQYFQRARMELHPHGSGSQVLLGLLIDELGYSFPPAGSDQIPASNTDNHHYFPETQHIVSHAFLDFFRERGGLEIFGYPRSDFFFEDGAVVQYFQRARMEWHRDRPQGSQIELTNVGEIYLERFRIPGHYDRRVPPPSRSRSTRGVTSSPATAASAPTEASSCEYFAETGHYVCDEFLSYFWAKGDIEIFGYPLTEAFDDPDHGGLHVQYFQRARMELHPHTEAGYHVLLGLLIDELGYSFPPAAADQIPGSNSASHHYFPETEHVVSYAFLDAFRGKGGLEIFGYPRSEFIYENGHIVQYFQRARMEWHPKNDPASLIQLTNVGEMYLERFEIPQSYRQPQPPGRPSQSSLGDTEGVQPQAVISLDVSASVQHAIIGPKGHQTLFVHVVSQQGQPVASADVSALVRYPGREQRLELPPTNERGFTKQSFELLPSPPGQKVVIAVTVTYGDLVGKTETSFLRWH